MSSGNGGGEGTAGELPSEWRLRLSEVEARATRCLANPEPSPVEARELAASILGVLAFLRERLAAEEGEPRPGYRENASR